MVAFLLSTLVFFAFSLQIIIITIYLVVRCRSHSQVVLNLLVAVGLWVLAGAAGVGVVVLGAGFGLRRLGSRLRRGLANVPGGFVEGEGVLAVASEEEGVGGAAGRVVAGPDRLGCGPDETEAKRPCLKQLQFRTESRGKEVNSQNHWKLLRLGPESDSI